jgi:hypothetical protein
MSCNLAYLILFQGYDKVLYKESKDPLHLALFLTNLCPSIQYVLVLCYVIMPYSTLMFTSCDNDTYLLPSV